MRVIFGIGGSGIYYHGVWQVFHTDPWDRGQIFQPAVTTDEVEVVFSLKDGMLDALYGGKPLARNVLLSKAGKNGYLEISTCANDWFAFYVVEISSQPTQLYEPSVSHPIL